MRLRLLYEDQATNSKNILLLVHPNYMVEMFSKYHVNEKLQGYFSKVIGTIRTKLNEGWVCVVSYMPLWGDDNESYEDRQDETAEPYDKFLEELNNLKGQKNFYFVDDSAAFGKRVSPTTVGLCSDDRVVNLILNSKNITLEVGGGYKSSCVAITLNNLGGEEFLKELNIDLVYNDLIFDYFKRA